MRTTKLTIGRDLIVICSHVANIFGRVDRQALPHAVIRTGTPKDHRLNIKNPRLFIMKQSQQQLRRFDRWAH